ncbi:hypothetical protein BJV77DRAFT_331519 [Russula vinacea]|nr:hypothetical protein BJV77DRAFT_331519 [Russula vinacea]
MLATISPSAHDLSQSMPYSHSRTTSRSALPDLISPSETKTCPGCQQTVMDENGGVVIAFGQSFFHVDCFKCAKCHDKVTADTNLLLLSDGQPVCSNCSYNCSVCHQPILDEAIMTGDDSYHAHCFKCRSCHNRIDELMFAKTSHGIYCMRCHNQRVARSRRHAQKQKERENAGPTGSSSNPHGITRHQPQSAPHGNVPTGLVPPDSPARSLSMSAAPSAQTSPALLRPATSESGVLIDRRLGLHKVVTSHPSSTEMSDGASRILHFPFSHLVEPLQTRYLYPRRRLLFLLKVTPLFPKRTPQVPRHLSSCTPRSP